MHDGEDDLDSGDDGGIPIYHDGDFGSDDSKADIWLAAFHAKLDETGNPDAALNFAIKSLGCFNAFKNIQVEIKP